MEKRYLRIFLPIYRYNVNNFLKKKIMFCFYILIVTSKKKYYAHKKYRIIFQILFLQVPIG